MQFHRSPCILGAANGFLMEVCVDSVESAVNAERGGKRNYGMNGSWQPVKNLEKTLMLGGIGGKRRRGRQRVRWLDGITDWMDVSLPGGLFPTMHGRVTAPSC